MKGTFIRHILLVVCFLFIISCAIPYGEKFSFGEISNQLIVGKTTESEIVSSLGEPYKKHNRSTEYVESSIYKYYYSEMMSETPLAPGTTKWRGFWVEFVEGVVNGYLYKSSLEEDSTDFDITLRKKITPNRSSTNDIIGLLGEPDGKIRMPSNLLAFLYGQGQEAQPPKGTSEIWTYDYSYLTFKKRMKRNHMKRIFIYCDSNEDIIAVKHLEGIF